jgi:hypothetical protein
MSLPFLRRAASPRRLRNKSWQSLGLNGLGLSLSSRHFLAVRTSVAFTTILHVVLVDTESFIHLGTKSFIIVDPVAMSAQPKTPNIE